MHVLIALPCYEYELWQSHVEIESVVCVFDCVAMFEATYGSVKSGTNLSSL